MKQKTKTKKYNKKNATRKQVKKTQHQQKQHNQTQKINASLKQIALKCSPISQKYKIKKTNPSCLSDSNLYTLRELWNKKNPQNKIALGDPNEIWFSLQEKLKNKCSNEICWLKQPFASGKFNKEINDLYSPKAPKTWQKNPNEWLSSIDIINVMKQYEKAYSCFVFLGPSPIDYDTQLKYGETVWPEIANLSLKNMIKHKKYKIGMIFNTDPHNKGGTHWISLFINIKKKYIFFYDSVGHKIPERLMNLVKNITTQGQHLNPKIEFTFDQNHPIEHQKGDGQCGVYSLYFIIKMLEDDITPEYIKTNDIKDDYMKRLRYIFFNNK
jgi:hypothetical protein